MRNLLFSVFAIGVAAVAAMTATTAMLNAPHRDAPAALSTASTGEPKSTLPSQLSIEGSAQTPPSGETPTPATSGDAKPDGAKAEETGKSSPLDRLARLAPPLIMGAYLLLVAFGVHQAFAATLGITSPPPGPPVQEALQVDVRVPPPAEPVEISINRSSLSFLERRFAEASAFAAGYHTVLTKGVDVSGRLLRIALLMLGCVLITSIASARVNINGARRTMRMRAPICMKRKRSCICSA